MKNLFLTIMTVIISFTSLAQNDMDDYEFQTLKDKSSLSTKVFFTMPNGTDRYIYKEYYDTLGVQMLLLEADRVLEVYGIEHGLDYVDFFEYTPDEVPNDPFSIFFRDWDLPDGGWAFISLEFIGDTEYMMVKFGIEFEE